jgi:hypothetical protein
VSSEKLIAEVGKIRAPRGTGTSVVESHYQSTASDDRKLMCVVVTVIFGVKKLKRNEASHRRHMLSIGSNRNR